MAQFRLKLDKKQIGGKTSPQGPSTILRRHELLYCFESYIHYIKHHVHLNKAFAKMTKWMFRSLGFPDIHAVLMWRAIVRQTNEVLRRHIRPTTFASSVLSEENANQIARTEQNEGRLQAAGQLISKLLKLQESHWTDSFFMALKNQHPEVINAVTKAKQDLEEEWASSNIISMSLCRRMLSKND